MSAISVMVLLLTVFPFATYALPPLAGAFLIPLVIECGKKWAFCAYAAVSLIALFIVPDMEAKTLFIVLFGYYPIVKALLESLKIRWVEWIAKLAVFNLATVGGYTILANIGFSLNDFRIERISLPLYACLLLFLLAGNVVFIIYDIGLSRLLPLYFTRFQPIFRRTFRF